MKKQYLFVLGLMMAGFTVSAQENLIINGGFEDWTGENPVNFEKVNTTEPIYNGGLTKETAIKHGGNNSCRQVSKPDTEHLEYSNLLDIVAGNSYTISYWYMDNSDDASTRLWSTWLTDTGTLDNPTAQALIQHTAYSTDSPNWVNKTVTVTAPTGATKLRYQIRTYSPTDGGGFIYYDDLSFVNNTASVGENTIIGLSLFPNPANGDIVYIASANEVAKAVTIFDMLGKQVVNTTVNNNGTIDVSSLTTGVYMVQVTEEGKTATKKLVVQ